jgi:regulator of nucleoside diphosphate kinase
MLTTKKYDMKYGSLILEKKEYVYIKRILNISGYAEDFETQKSLQRLSKELKNALIVNEADMPEDVIRFNSRIMVNSEKGWKKTIQLVIPPDRDAKQDKISILTPMGAALFGYSEGDAIEWDFPSGEQKLKIITVTQEKTKKKLNTY